MKINLKNTSDKLKAVVAEANGRATRHTAEAYDLVNAALDAEERLAQFGVPVKARSGARARFVSGESLPNAYGYNVTRTVATFERGSRDWFLTAIGSYSWSPNGAFGIARVLLSAKQLDAAEASRMRRLRIEKI